METKHNIEGFEMPCEKLAYCPYGYLVEYSPLEEEPTDRSCPIYGHDCPAFHFAVEIIDYFELVAVEPKSSEEGDSSLTSIADRLRGFLRSMTSRN